MKQTWCALVWSLGLLAVGGPISSSDATDIEARFDQFWALHEDIARAKTTLWVWENAYADRQIELADPTLIYLDIGRAYGSDRKVGLRSVVTANKDALLQSVKLTFAGLSRAEFRKGWRPGGRLPPGGEEFRAEDAVALRDRLIQEYMGADARIRETEESSLQALKVSIAELKLDIERMEGELVALADELAAAALGVESDADAPPPAGRKRFQHPRWQGGYVDNCLRFADQCGGGAAAAEFCKLLSFSGAADYEVDVKDAGSHHDRTIVLGEAEIVGGQKNPRRICSPKGGPGTTASPTGKCVGFVFIECR